MWTETQTVTVASPGHEKEIAEINKLFAQMTALAANTRFCADDAIQEKLIVFGEPQPGDLKKMNCGDRRVRKTAAGYEIRYSCKREDRTLPMRIEIRGDLSREFTSRVTLNEKLARAEGVNRFHYLGACTDLKPGELMIPGMPKMRMERAFTPVRK